MFYVMLLSCLWNISYVDQTLFWLNEVCVTYHIHLLSVKILFPLQQAFAALIVIIGLQKTH